MISEINAIRGARRNRISADATMSNNRLIAEEERVRPKRRTPSRVSPPRRSNSTDEPTTSKRRGRPAARAPPAFGGPAQANRPLGGDPPAGAESPGPPVG